MFKKVLQNKPIILAHVDQELRYTWIYNPHPDFVEEQVIGKTDVEIADNPGNRKLMELKQRILDQGINQNGVISFPLSEGDRVYRVVGEPIFDDQGAVIGVTTASMDITELLGVDQGVLDQFIRDEGINYEQVGQKIKQIREQKGLTQVELATQADLSQSYISSLEKNEKSPTIRTLSYICRALDIEMISLLAGGWGMSKK